MAGKRGLNSDDARKVRQQGHDDALEFAISIGLEEDYKNNAKAKKDVVDLSGDTHSVKGGQVKRQIFLYSVGRFEADEAFAAMNGVGQILIQCINSFPLSFDEYQNTKHECKENLRQYMRALKEKLSEPYRLRAFLGKSMFNGSEVDYLTIKFQGIFHVFYYKDVLDILVDSFEVVNSQAKSAGQYPEQKVLLRYKGLNVGELEMRNDSKIHYREIRFNMKKPKFMELIFEKSPAGIEFNNKVKVYGNAVKKFGRWKK